MVNSSFQYFPAIPISHSKDLCHWEVIGHAITNPDWLDLSQTLDSRGIWAPDISYHNGKFFIFAALRHNSQDPEVSPMRSQLVMTSDKPEGPYSRPAELPVDNIDPSHFVDEDGKHYMVTAPAVTLVPLSDDCTQITGEIKQVWAGTGERCPEGPHIFRKDDYYYAMIAEGGTGYGHGINIARSKNLYGPYEECPYNPVLRQTDPEAPIQRSGHGKLVKTQNNEWWCVYLCGRPNGGNYTTLGRETALDPVHWTEDGWFIVNDSSPSTVQVSPDLPEVTYEKQHYFDFTEGALSEEWEWLRNPDMSSVTFDNKGIAIRAQKGFMYEISAKNILLMREKEFRFTAETDLSFRPEEEGESAGIACYYSTNTYIRFGLCRDGLEVALNKGDGETRITLLENINSERIHLRVVVNGQTRSFFYSTDNKKWQSAACLTDCTFLCDEGVPGDRKRHTGTLTGIYALGGNTDSDKKAYFRNFTMDY